MKEFSLIVHIGQGPSGNIFCEVSLEERKPGELELTIHGVEGPYSNGNCRGGCGQIVDSILDYALADAIKYNLEWNKEATLAFCRVWERWHLNGMTAGSPRQEEWLRSREPFGDYAKRCQALAQVGLLFDDEFIRDGKPYKYGSAWLHEELPQDVLAFVNALPETTAKPAWV